MTRDKLDLYEKCYSNWNGTSVMEGAFKELLGEVRRLTDKLQRHCPHFGRTIDNGAWHCPNCDKSGPEISASTCM